MFRIYNTLGRKKDDFEALTGKKAGDVIKLYTCGPTVYHFAHIGNLRTYIYEDVLERTLGFLGYEVDRVLNITDVGHLTSDADEGEDKMDKAAAREGKSVEEIIKFYTDKFVSDCRKLNIILPKKFFRASHYIESQQKLIKLLFEKGYAYDTAEAVYFDVSKFPNYGALTGQKLSEKEVGARSEVVTGEHKKNPQDFALWFKLVGRFKNHIQHWPSSWGEGFPGWHIECSALIHEFLGEPIDIHAGGVDHIGVHHTNEIAQSEGALGVPLSRFWFHAEHLLMDEAKMAKSEGNICILDTLIERGYDPLAFRYLALGSNYRTRSNFNWEIMDAAAKGLTNLRNAFIDLRNRSRKENKEDVKVSEGIPYLEEFRNSLSDDLNTSQALAVTFKTIQAMDLSAGTKRALLAKYDEVLGLGLEAFAAQHENIVMPEDVQELLKKRELARSNQQFTQSDELREEIEALGYTVSDTSDGPVVSPKPQRGPSTELGMTD